MKAKHTVTFRRNGCFIERTEYESYEDADAAATNWENVSLECEATIRKTGTESPPEEEERGAA